MVAGSIVAAVAALTLVSTAHAVKVHHDGDFAAGNELKHREVTVTVTYCPETVVPPPVYTTAPLPPVDSTTTVPATLTTTSMVVPGSDTGEGPSSLPISSLTPIVPIPVTSTTYDTAESTHPTVSTSDTTTMTGTGAGSATTHHTIPTTTHSVAETTSAGGPSSALAPSGGANAANANLGLVILVAVAALA